jgi:acyl carrier protein
MDKVQLFLLELRQQFEDSDSELLSIDTKFDDLETFDSLTRYSIIALVKDEYKIQLQDDIFKEIKTPRQLYKIIFNE